MENIKNRIELNDGDLNNITAGMRTPRLSKFDKAIMAANEEFEEQAFSISIAWIKVLIDDGKITEEEGRSIYRKVMDYMDTDAFNLEWSFSQALSAIRGMN